jgi:hypothetical protein
MLYWAEGDKNTRNTARLSNSDPALLRYFALFARETFGLGDTGFRVTCHLFPDHVESQRSVEQFWLDQLALPAACMTKSIVNVYSKYSFKKRRNVLPYGTCRLTIASVMVVQHLYGAIQEYGGFDRPEWLG